jgi:hypothetical protein
MLLKYVSAFLKSMQPLFEVHEAVRLNPLHFKIMKRAIREMIQQKEIVCDQAKLLGILGRIHRRMKNPNNPHFWRTEYEYIADTMILTLRKHHVCRSNDTLNEVRAIFLRKNKNNKEDPSSKKRCNDKAPIISIFS